MTETSIEFAAVSQLRLAFGVIPTEVKAALRPALLEAANIIAADYRERATPGVRSAVYAKASFASRSGAVVGADARVAPEAKVLEVGNAATPDASQFRHPVFGHTWWVEQPKHPALFPAVAEHGDSTRDAVGAAVAAVMRLNGLTLS